ncbi:MAG TPA: EAL domain-containing protein [Burkholderiaceae bacterium]|nr:EAL domain-containing protein [Burkholderiaceae bacterium]
MRAPIDPRLVRQLARLGLDADTPPGPEAWPSLVASIARAYRRLGRMLRIAQQARRVAADELARARDVLHAERLRLETHLRERAAELEQSRADLVEAQQLAGLGSWSAAGDGSRVEVSRQLARLIGLEVEPRSLEALLDFVVEDDRAGAQRALAAAMREPRRLNGELRLRDARGELRWFACTIVSLPDPQGRVARVRGAMLDVTARRLAEGRVQRLAFHDDLTGLPNRAAFRERIAQAVASAREGDSRFALLFLDLDGFKEINDSLGHDAGDELLRQVSARIRGCLRQGDGLARFGGDEFLVLIDPMRRRADVEAVTRKILTAVATPIQLGTTTATVSASIGIAIFPDDGDDPSRLLKNADAAMYRAKQEGRNAMRFYVPQINASLLEKVALSNDLRAAVGAGALGAAWQPIVDGRSGRLLGVEALARWSHPVRGAVPPSSFVPLAEETGLIGRIGASMLARACAQMRAWDGGRRADAGPYVSVNVSPAQLRAPGFAAELRAVLASSGLPASRLQIELTEGTVMADPAHAARVLGELSEMGVRIALDDFGTGHSSLAYLRTYPIDCIKIDRAFVADLGRADRHEPIVPAIIAIAHSLGAGVVAEGVETAAQREALLALGCRGMQGYLFSRPLPADEFGARFLEGEADVPLPG